MSRPTICRVAATLLAIVFAVRLGLQLVGHQREIPGTEEYWVAQELVAGNGFSFPSYLPWPLLPIGTSGVHPTAWADPIYTIALSGMLRFFGAGHRLAATILDLLLFALVLGMAYRLTERLIGSVAGLGVLIILGRNRAFTSSAGQMNGTMLATAAVLLSCLLLVAVLERPSRRGSGWLGFTLGLSVLACPAALLFVPLSAAILAWSARKQPREAIARASLVAAVALLAMSPWAIRNYLALGEWIPVRTGAGSFGFYTNIAAAGTVDPTVLPAHLQPPWTAATPRVAVKEIVGSRDRREALEHVFLAEYSRAIGPEDFDARNEAQRDSWLSQKVNAFLLSHPLLSARLAVPRLEVFAKAAGLSGLVVFVLAVAGGVLAIRTATVLPLAMLAFSFMAPFLVFVCVYPRYRAPIEPVLTILAIFAVWVPPQKLPWIRRLRATLQGSA